MIYKCKYCNKEFNSVAALGGHTNYCPVNPDANFHYNTKAATSKLMEIHKPILYNFICEKCGKEFLKEMSQQRYSNKRNHPRFCCSSCANSHVLTKESRQKQANSLKEWYKNSNVSNRIYINKDNLKQYESKIISDKNLIREKIKKETEIILYQQKCQYCGAEFISKSKSAKYCSTKCRKEALYPLLSSAGKKSAKTQESTRRSKNEKLFCRLCEQHFQKVTHNDPIFNGWDADILIHDFKIAVLWNGIWHYKKITKSHSVQQVQNRDKIKVDEINKSGWKEYIIQDLGQYNEKFVKEKFEEFVDFIKQYCPVV